jgi:UDP:flavonoid glycosyltransferase YjiC (YdhE family)
MSGNDQCKTARVKKWAGCGVVFELGKKNPQRLGAEVANLVEQKGELIFI